MAIIILADRQRGHSLGLDIDQRVCAPDRLEGAISSAKAVRIGSRQGRVYGGQPAAARVGRSLERRVALNFAVTGREERRHRAGAGVSLGREVVAVVARRVVRRPVGR